MQNFVSMLFKNFVTSPFSERRSYLYIIVTVNSIVIIRRRKIKKKPGREMHWHLLVSAWIISDHDDGGVGGEGACTAL